MGGWRGGRAANAELLRSTQAKLDALKDAFFSIDQAQRSVRASVDAYRQFLPERAARSGLIPRHQVLDQRAEEQVADYLAVVDRLSKFRELSEPALRQAGYECDQLASKLHEAASEFDRFQETFSAELDLVGRERRRIGELQRSAASAVAEAQRLWGELRAQRLESEIADAALAKARVVQRGVDAWTPGEGMSRLHERVALVDSFVAEVRAEVENFPKQVDRVRRRGLALQTRLDAIETRSRAIEEDLRSLRREFSIANWRDLDGCDRLVGDLIVEGRGAVDLLVAAVARQAWRDALRRLDESERIVDAADSAVDAPRRRLDVLRQIKIDPSFRLGRARFALKDAQVLVVNGPVRDTGDIAAELDGFARRLDGLRALTDEVHPDYWSILGGAEQIEREIATQVARYRERAR